MNILKLNTIYPAFMGECNMYGIGAPCTFVRLAGCNLRCYYKTKGVLCDTPEALTTSCGRDVSVEDIIIEVSSLGNDIICLTGGEPLLQDVSELLTKLSYMGYKVVIETNGSKPIHKYRHIKNVSFIVDVKSNSSGEKDSMLEDNYELLDENDFVKFVIDTETDYLEFIDWCAGHNLRCNVAVGLFWGSSIDYRWLIDKVKHRNVYLNMQTHKMACLYDVHKNSPAFCNLIVPKDL